MANNGTPGSATTYVTTGQKFGSGALSVVAGGTVTLPATLSLDMTSNSVTWECWVSRSAVPSALAVVLASTSMGYIAISTSGYPVFNIGSTKNVTVTGTTNICDGSWHHLAVVLTPTSVTGYLDGALVGTASAVATTTTTGAVIIGALMTTGSNQFTATGTSIDEVAIWNGAAKYTAAFTPQTAAYTGAEGMTALYHLDGNANDNAVAAPTKYTVSPGSASVAAKASTVVTFTLDAAAASAVTITPSDGGAGGTWSAGYLVIAAGQMSATLTYTAGSAAGSVTLTGTNDGGLTNGTAGLSVTTVASKVTLSGPATLTVGSAATYTVALDASPSSAVTVTLAGTLAGSFSQASVTFAAGATALSQTVTFTASAAGSGSISATNSASLTNPAALTVTAGTTATAPGAPGVSLTAGNGQVVVTVTAPASNGGAAVTGYPIYVGSSAGGESGTPVTTLTATGSYTLTGLANGAPVYVKVGATNSVGTTVGAEQSATPVAPATTTAAIAIDSSAFLFSPGNWYGDTGRSGSLWRRTWNVGAYFVFTWAASSSPSAVLHLGPQGSGGYVTLFLNGVATQVATTGDVTLSGITPSAQNVLFAIFSNTPQSARWNAGANNLMVSGVTLDTASSAGVSTAGGKGWVKLVGDSITEGIEANNNKDNILYGYAFQLLQALRAQGYEVCVSACGSSGYLTTGDSTKDVPAYYYISGSQNGLGGTYSDSKSRWSLIDKNVSALDSAGHLSAYGDLDTEPVAIAVNYLTNEALSSSNQSDAQAAMTQSIAAHRKAAPDAWLFLIMPFGFHYSGKYDPSWLTIFNSAISTYKAANPTDTKVISVDIGADTSNVLEKNKGWYISASDDVHPLAPGHALVAPIIQTSFMTHLESRNRQVYTVF